MTKQTMILITLTDLEQELIEAEIKEGIRPKNWDVITHPDHTVWKDILATHNVGINIRI